MGRITIGTIAAMAGISKGSASKALNNRPGVSDETRSRVLRLAEELHFHPDASARALARSRVGAIGLAIPSEQGPLFEGAYWASFVASCATCLAGRGLRLELFVPDAGEEGMKTFEKALRTRCIDGAIIGAELLFPRVLEALEGAELPFVKLGPDGEGSCYSVDVDNQGGTREIARLMIEAGPRDIAMLTGPESYEYLSEREAGYREARIAAGLGETGERIIRVPYRATAARDAIVTLLAADNAPQGLLIAAGGPLMIGALQGLRESDDEGLIVAVFDDSPILEMLDPPVSAVRQPIAEMAEAAVQLILALLGGQTPPQERIVLPASVLRRGALR